MVNHLHDIIRRHKAGESVGIYSVCSAHPTVIEASILQAREDGTHLLIESTSNQVDQFGGYTGLIPVRFRDLVFALADKHGFPRDRVILGGDHLGPNRWQSKPASEAMRLAEDLVAAYVEAGYTKIHLDCSMSCADDPPALGDDLVANRTALLLRVAEESARRTGSADEISYVIGTEVPKPGGAHETLHGLSPTSPEAAQTTLEHHRAAIKEVGLEEIWPRIIAMVVQPGVEFDHCQVIDYERGRTEQLRTVLDGEARLVFEAHSTDYQQAPRLAELVADHWAILKVGPALTFAMREALFALARIEDEIVSPRERSGLVEVLEQRMLSKPGHWKGYYEGGAGEQKIARRFSYSDRLRYYWSDLEVELAETRLYENLSEVGIPLPLISQYLPLQYTRVRAGLLKATPSDLVIDKIRDALRPYSSACSPRNLNLVHTGEPNA
ncbi:D-tagatose-bisphosphate aldolase, class II, non-catalytic subunit [Rhodococcus sp. NPDC049939]|uniref:D-tagatose-bisphosphate aldolase, class II, non-catalytic subunit n=1 Tax=Rhodococcus sp. NPDC049939 TaxID=3155511 RepID=UPI003407E512